MISSANNVVLWILVGSFLTYVFQVWDMALSGKDFLQRPYSNNTWSQMLAGAWEVNYKKKNPALFHFPPPPLIFWQLTEIRSGWLEVWTSNPKEDLVIPRLNARSLDMDCFDGCWGCSCEIFYHLMCWWDTGYFCGFCLLIACTSNTRMRPNIHSVQFCFQIRKHDWIFQFLCKVMHEAKVFACDLAVLMATCYCLSSDSFI